MKILHVIGIPLSHIKLSTEHSAQRQAQGRCLASCHSALALDGLGSCLGTEDMSYRVKRGSESLGRCHFISDNSRRLPEHRWR